MPGIVVPTASMTGNIAVMCAVTLASRALHLPVPSLVLAERVWILINERFGCHLVKLLRCMAN
jgi:hypothetical protein